MQDGAGRRIRRDLVVAASLAFTLGCAQQAAFPSPAPAAFAVKAGELVSDAAHSGGTPGFWFLQPMFTQVTTTGTFESGLTPTVRIDRLDAGGSPAGTVGTFTKTTGTGGDLLAVTTGAYQVNWHTKTAGVPDGTICRVHVTLPGGRELGFADVVLLANGSQAKNYSTNEYVALVDDRTLSIRFFVATGVVDPDGDGVLDYLDNCPVDANASQLDSNGDGIGDACQCKAIICSAVDQCHDAGTCDPSSGVCSNPAKADGSACSDGNACTGGTGADACAAGTCVAGTPVVCDDANPCTTDACEPSAGCTFGDSSPACGESCTSEPSVVAIEDGNVWGIAVDGNFVYWTNSTTGTISRQPLSGGVPTVLAVGQDRPLDIAVDGGNVYWTNEFSGTVARLSLQGGTAESIVVGINRPVGVHVTSTDLFWTSGLDGTVMRMPLSGGTATVVASGQAWPSGMTVDEGTLCWANNSGNAIVQMALAGGPVTPVATGLIGPNDVVADSTALYWTDYYGGQLMRLKKGNSTPDLLLSTSGPSGIAVSDKCLYWASYGDGRVMKMAKP